MNARIAKQRAALVLDQPFFGVLALRLRVVEDTGCETFWVNGIDLGYNPDYLGSLTDLELRGIIAHEVLHVANGHCWRRGERDSKRWNDACDYAITPVIRDAGLVLPIGVLDDARFHGKSAEEIYRHLAAEDRQPPPSLPSDGADEGSASEDESNSSSESDDDEEGENEDGEGQPVGAESAEHRDDAPNPCGEVRPYPDSDAVQQEAAWQVAVLQAVKAARMHGSLSGSLQGMVELAVQPVVDWRAWLMRFAQQYAPTDYSYTLPNRRYTHLGLYLPALRQEAMGELVFVRDASGSVFDATQAAFAAEIQAVVDAVQPERLIVLDCDTRVTQAQTFERGDSVELEPIRGGGGTSFVDPFVHLAREGIEPACLVYLTDMQGEFPSVPPQYPVLWASTTPIARLRPPPFGEVVEVLD